MSGGRRGEPTGRRTRAGCAALCLVAAAVLAACSGRETGLAARALGDPDAGRLAIGREACGSCHVIPGAPRAAARVGPPLSDLRRQTMIAGVLPNTPENLVRWLRSPQSVKRGDVMPDLALSEGEARDIAAYLYDIR